MTKYDKLHASVARMLTQITRNHQERFGGDWEEVASDVGLCYTLAAQSYKRGRGSKFSTWIRYKVPLAMLDLKRRRSSQQKSVSLSKDPLYEESSFRMIDFLDSLSEDARAVTLAVIDSPRDIIMAMRERGGENNKNRRHAVVEFFKLLGWSKSRISDTFDEIRKALS